MSDIVLNTSAAAGLNDPNLVCIAKAQLAALLSAAATPVTPISVSSSASNPRDASPQNPSLDLTNSGNPDNANPSSPAQPPVLKINGDNPAHVSVGATISGPQADLNLGIKTFLNGALVSDIVLDTSAPGTDTIDYVVSDPTGLTATSTRTVIVNAPANDLTATTTPPLLDAPSIVPDYNASTTLPTAAASSSAE